MNGSFQDLAKKLITINMRSSSRSQSSAIFGSVANLDSSAFIQKAPYRIGMWPFTSVANQEQAHAIWVVLSYLLETWDDITVYRLPVNLNDVDLAMYEPESVSSVFSVDDWQLDELDENIALWGSISRNDDESLLLSISLENDLLDTDETQTLEWQADDWGGVVALLPSVAEAIANSIEAQRKDNSKPTFKIQDSDILSLPASLFDWERNIFLHLWGWDWSDDQILDDAHRLINEANSSVSIWTAASAMARSFLPGLIVVGDLLIDLVEEALEKWNYIPEAAITLSDALWQAGYIPEAISILNISSKHHSLSLFISRKIALREAEMGNVSTGIKTLQVLFIKELFLRTLPAQEQVPLFYAYVDYGSLLQLAMQSEINVEKLLWSEAGTRDALAREAVSAYELGLEIKSDSLGVMYNLALLLIYLDATRFWEVFESIVTQDTEREHINDILDTMHDLDDLEPGIAIVRKAVAESPTIDRQITLARLLIINEENLEALEVLEQVHQHTEDTSIRSEIESLKLVCKNPDFEFMFGEAAAIVDAGNVPSDATLEFLEEVIEEAPLFIDGYIVLAQAYIAIEDYESAIEVLLDADKTLPNQPDVIELLARCLWETDAYELAFQYLNRGLEQAPSHVPLLLRAGRMLFDNEQYEDAKQFIARAEIIAPRSGALAALRAYIAREVESNE